MLKADLLWRALQVHVCPPAVGELVAAGQAWVCGTICRRSGKSCERGGGKKKQSSMAHRSLLKTGVLATPQRVPVRLEGLYVSYCRTTSPFFMTKRTCS